jgi:hypothetical protein
MRRPGRGRQACPAPAAGTVVARIALTVLASCAEDDCVDRMIEVKDCGLEYRDPNICDTAAGACLVACHEHVGCAVIRSLLDGAEPPDSLTRCTAQCVEPFRCDDGATTIDARWQCDGEADCRDGSDEADCAYFECTDGQLVRDDARCDEYAECADGSDEEGC